MKKPAATTAKPSANLAAIDRSLPRLPDQVYDQASIGLSTMIQIGVEGLELRRRPGEQVRAEQR